MVRIRSLLTLLGIFCTFISAAIFLTTSQTKAGFEWVPAEKREAVAPTQQPTARHIEQENKAGSEMLPLLTPDNEGQAERLAHDNPKTNSVRRSPISTKGLTREDINSEPEQGMKVIRRRKMTASPKESVQRPQEVKTHAETPTIFMPSDAPEAARNAANSKSINQAKQAFESDGAKMTAVLPAPMSEEKRTEQDDSSGHVQFENISGFGKDMPLAFALNQIIPPGYVPSLEKNINPSAMVSWAGGKPWPSVIDDMLQPLNLSVRLRGKTVFVYDPKHESEGNLSVLEQDTSQPSDVRPANLTPSSIDRFNILAPTEHVSSQPIETMDKIGLIASTHRVALAKDRLNQGEKSNFVKTNNGTPTIKHVWTAKGGDSVRDTLEKWANVEGTQVIWQTDKDFQLSSNVLVKDDFKNAVMMVFDHALEGGKKPSLMFLDADRNNAKSRVIVK